MIEEIGQGGGHGVIILGRDYDVGISIGDDLIGLLENFWSLASVRIVMVGPLQEWQLELIWVCVEF